MPSKSYPPKGTNTTYFNPQLYHFDMICGQTLKENKILKLENFIKDFIIGVLAIGITFFLFKKTQIVPALVTMSDFGQTQYIGEVSKKNYQNFNIPEIAISYQVKDFLRLIKTLSIDENIVKNNIEKTYHLLTTTSAAKYSTLIRENNPFLEYGDITKEIFFETEPLRLSTDTYQVDYKLVSRSLTGTVLKEARQRALLTVNNYIPSEEDIQDNPLGIYITDFDIQDIKIGE